MTRGPDKRPRRMHPASLGNLQPSIPAVQDGKISIPTRIRLTPADARAWARMSPEERSEVVERGLQARADGVHVVI